MVYDPLRSSASSSRSVSPLPPHTPPPQHTPPRSSSPPLANMSLNRDPRLTPTRAAPNSAARRTAAPEHITLPPQPQFRDTSASPAPAPGAGARGLLASPAASEPATARNVSTGGGVGVTSLSFKRPRGQTPKTFMQRASGAFRRDSDAGASSRFGRTNTRSIHIAPQDASAWSRTTTQEAKLPSLFPSAPSPKSTPIPTLPFIVLCLVCFGEFSSAGVAGPFLFFQIEGFNVGGEAEVGQWAGIVSAAFFFAQFLTSMLWASMAESHGRRIVLLVSLLGNALTLVLFGMSTNIRMALAIRFAQGLFNGAVGVAKGAVRNICDESNEARAMSVLSFAWGMGGIAGPILGGLLEHPVEKYPFLFGGNVFLKENPYVLPCIVGASFTATGAFLTLFIGPDGGPREGQIRLEKDQEDGASTASAPVPNGRAHAIGQSGSWGRAAGRVSGYFGSGVQLPPTSDVSLGRTRTLEVPSSGNGLPRTFTQQVDEDTGGPPSPIGSEDESGAGNTTMLTHGSDWRGVGASGYDRQSLLSGITRPLSRTAARHRGLSMGGGSAYGYDRRFSRNSTRTTEQTRVTSGAYGPPRSRAPGSAGGSAYAPDFEDLETREFQPLSFAQRFLLSQDDQVHGITDLWIAAANAQEDYADVFEETEEEDEEYEGEETYDSQVVDESDEDVSAFGYGTTPADEEAPRHLPPLNFAQAQQRRMSRSSARSSNGTRRTSGLYANVGIESPLLSPSALPTSPGVGFERTNTFDPTLAGIPESARNSMHLPSKILQQGNPPKGRGPSLARIPSASVAGSSTVQTETGQQASQPVSVWSQLPLFIIAQYALISFHSSTFEQVFMAFLVTPYKSGGLGLGAGEYAEMIATMCVAQIVFQFYFYPNVGPPQGRLSHLAMLRLGTSLYLVVYSLFPLLRFFVAPDSDALVMFMMISFAALRWLANITSFTSSSVLLGALTPVHLVALANGLAQTCSSAMRTIGPIVGGWLFARGIEGGVTTTWDPANYAAFYILGLIGLIGCLHATFVIR